MTATLVVTLVVSLIGWPVAVWLKNRRLAREDADPHAEPWGDQ